VKKCIVFMQNMCMSLLPSVARQLPILDVTWRSCFFVPSPRSSYIGGNSTESMSFGRSDANIFRKLSSARAFDDSLFLFDFYSILIRFYLFCIALAWLLLDLRISVYISTCMQYVGYSLHAVYWILTMQRIDNILNNSSKDSLIYFFLVIYMKAFIFRFAV
jgi:hypothetical protein